MEIGESWCGKRFYGLIDEWLFCQESCIVYWRCCFIREKDCLDFDCE